MNPKIDRGKIQPTMDGEKIKTAQDFEINEPFFLLTSEEKPNFSESLLGSQELQQAAEQTEQTECLTFSRLSDVGAVKKITASHRDQLAFLTMR